MNRYDTHIVTNQVPPLADYSLFDTDPVLQEAVLREGAANYTAGLREHGAGLGRADTLAAGALANRHPPQLVAYDPTGHRVDQVAFHPAWHQLMTGIARAGLHSAAWFEPAPGAHVARAAAYLMQGQVEAGTLCPTTMTFGAVAVLQHEPAGVVDLARHWLPALAARSYDPADAPLPGKRGALIGMAMTEKQGGSDVSATTTSALPLEAPGRGRAYAVTGHKWFFSVPQSDAHLVLAQTQAGLSCLFVPRWMPSGERNAVRLQRLKDKLGNRSNASAEVEFHDAWGMLVGEPGRGVATLIQVASHARLDCVLGSAALLRQAVVQAMHHASYRQVAGKRLIEQPLMQAVLADLALESEGATLLALRLARAVDAGTDPAMDSPLEQALRRIGTPAAKFFVCKRAVAAIGECLEVWGGNGYVEDGPMPRLFREAPVNAIWEGSSNVMCLDVLRALQADATHVEALMTHLEAGSGVYAAYDDMLARWQAALSDQALLPARARAVAGGLALLLQAAAMIAHAPAAVADAFVASRLAHVGERMLGELPVHCDRAPMLHRAWPLWG